MDYKALLERNSALAQSEEEKNNYLDVIDFMHCVGFNYAYIYYQLLIYGQENKGPYKFFPDGGNSFWNIDCIRFIVRNLMYWFEGPGGFYDKDKRKLNEEIFRISFKSFLKRSFLHKEAIRECIKTQKKNFNEQTTPKNYFTYLLFYMVNKAYIFRGYEKEEDKSKEQFDTWVKTFKSNESYNFL